MDYIDSKEDRIKLDKGLFFGKGLFETILVKERAVFLEEHINRIWNRFYKVDQSRNRNDGGTGIGLSFVKAVMQNYKKGYGVVNKENGVEFYIELELKI